jgi:hypothetical protein
VVGAEDARLLGDMAAVRRAYRQLYDLNRCGSGACLFVGGWGCVCGWVGCRWCKNGAVRCTNRAIQLQIRQPQPTARNRDLIADHERRATNHRQLLDGLRQVNRMIQRAARLRVGAPAARVIAACRAAVKQGEVQAIVRVVREGEAGGGAAGGG